MPKGPAAVLRRVVVKSLRGRGEGGRFIFFMELVMYILWVAAAGDVMYVLRVQEGVGRLGSGVWFVLGGRLKDIAHMNRRVVEHFHYCT